MFTKQKIFKNPAINTLCDRLYYYTKKNNAEIILTGSVAKILEGVILKRKIKDVDFMIYDNHTYHYLLRNLQMILGENVEVRTDRLRVVTKYISFEFFDRRTRQKFQTKRFRNIKIQRF